MIFALRTPLRFVASQTSRLHPTMAPKKSLPPPAWLAVMVAAAIVGTFLRLDQLLSQVLIDDEWHAIHQMLDHAPRVMFFDFGFADYSIPLGILDWYEAHWWGISEIAMRLPMVACGLATLVVLPLYIAPRLGSATAAVFALLVAISPLLVIFSRMARPYAITLLLAWIAHGAFQRYHASTHGHMLAGLAYGAATTLATWLHPIVALFVLAPMLWALAELAREAPAKRRARWVRLASLAIPTIGSTTVLLLPPLLAHPGSLAAKSGVEMPGVDTLIGVWYAWLGTPSTLVVILCVALAAYGARDVWRALREARTGMLGVALTLAAVMLTRPASSQNALTLARYLLPFLPLLLLCVAAGSVSAARQVAARTTAVRRGLAAGITVLPIVALAAQSPLVPMLRRPNAQTLHAMYHFDFRPDRNPYLKWFDQVPLSPFWAGLAVRPAGSIRVAAAPFYFESFNWDAPRWERVSGQTVLPGYLTGLCVERRWGEVPLGPMFRFRNAVHLADETELVQRGIDYVVWQKPYVRTDNGVRVPIGEDTAHCEAAMRKKFGPPAFEDPAVIVFRIALPEISAPSAQR